MNARAFRSVRQLFLKVAALLVLGSVTVTVSAETSLELLTPTKSSMDAPRVVYQEHNAEVEYVLPLGPMERIDGRWQPESKRSMQAAIDRQTLEFGAQVSEQEVYDLYQEKARSHNSQTLYRCQGRDCGQSNRWANDFFHRFQLYGSEGSQRLSTQWFKSAGREYYLVLYMVRRGNKRVYLQQDLLSRPVSSTASAIPVPQSGSLWQQLENHGLLRLDTNNGAIINAATGVSIREPWLQAISTLLAQHPRVSIEVVAHSYRGESSMASSKSLADTIRDKLLNAGLESGRVSSHGLGSLAPLQTIPESPRVDILLRP